MTKRYASVAVLSMVAALVVLCPVRLAAISPDCSEPPFIRAGVESNLLFILDNSGSMCEFAYKEATGLITTGGTYHGTWTWNNTCANQPPCGNYGSSSCPTGTDPRVPTPCTDTFNWGPVGPPGDTNDDYGTCTYSRGCRVTGSGRNKNCTQASWTTTCTKTSGIYNSSYSCDTSGNCTITVSISSSSNSAYTGYDHGKKYYGLFDTEKTYKYNNANGYKFFYTQDGWDAVEIAVPDPNNPSQTITVRGACTSGGACDKFSGNWLNWLTMRRIDVAKKVLTGGRLGGDTNNWVLVGTPTDRDFYKVFNDDGSIGVYYTPFRQGLAVHFYNNKDTAGRTPTVTTLPGKTFPQGKYAPLFTMYGGTMSGTTFNAGALTSLGTNAAYGNLGEPSLSGQRSEDGSYYVAVKYGAVGATEAVDTPPKGVIQNFFAKVRAGFMHFNFGRGPAEGATLGSTADSWNIDGDGTTDYTVKNADGGHVVNPVGDPFKANLAQKFGDGSFAQVPDMIFNMNEVLATTWTPLAETLRAAKNYFKQDTTCYPYVDQAGVLRNELPATRNADGSYTSTKTQPLRGGPLDPYVYNGILQPCARSYIILVSDGEATQDHPCACCGSAASGATTCASDCTPITATFRFNGIPASDTSCASTRSGNNASATDYLDDIAYIMHTQDMRSDLGSTCTITPGASIAVDHPQDCQTVTLFTVFAFEQSQCSWDSLARAALAGGFDDRNKDNQPGSTLTGVDDWRQAYNQTNFTGYVEWDASTPPNRQPDHFFAASDDVGTSLESFLNAIFAQIALGGSASAVATQPMEQEYEGDVVIGAAFDAADPENRANYLWYGHLEAYWPDAEGKYEFDYPENFTLFCWQLATPHQDVTGHSPSCWDSGTIMKSMSAGDRKIFTVVNNKVVWYTTAAVDSSDGLALLNLMRDRSKPAGNQVPSGDEAKALIQWVRGACDKTDASGNCLITIGTTDYGPYRNRKGNKLGDIVYSTPVVVGPPSLASVSGMDPDVEAFWAYRYDKQHRDKVVYVGANDGMIHAFLLARWDDVNSQLNYNCSADASGLRCGSELWAYIPSNLLGELAALAKVDYGSAGGSCRHRAMVDLTTKGWDVFMKPPAGQDGRAGCALDSGCSSSDKRCWRTVIIGGERGGGDVYFALDVTDPTAPADLSTDKRVLWEYSVLKNLAVVYNSSSTVQDIALPFQPYDSNADTFDDVYFNLQPLPMTWSEPTLGRVKIPDQVKFWRYRGSPPALKTTNKGPSDSSEWDFDACNNKRHLVFIGGGFRVFNPTTASLGATPHSVPSPNDSYSLILKALGRPNLMGIDIETGENYLQVLWPLIVKARVDGKMIGGVSRSELPDAPMPYDPASTTQFIPWAMGGPVALDVWDDNDNAVGEDGFVDTLYVGDMHGYLYRLRFNLKQPDATIPSSAYPKGVAVEYWRTKPIPSPCSPTDGTTKDQYRNQYRDCRQPITVPPEVTWDQDTVNSNCPSLRVIFGTGKFDDVYGKRWNRDCGPPPPPASSTNIGDDKSDDAQMSFYNLKDMVIANPTISDPTISASASNTYTVTPSTGAVASSGSNMYQGFVVSGTNFWVSYSHAPNYEGMCGPELNSLGLPQRGVGLDSYTQYGCGETVDACTGTVAALFKTACERSCDDSCDQQCTAKCKGSTDTACKSTCVGNCLSPCKATCQSCTTTTRTGCCNWTLCDTLDADGKCTATKADCCHSTCAGGTDCPKEPPDTPPSCWSCVYDFANPGERVIGKALILNGLVFFTTYAPVDEDCSSGGSGWLYILEYRCQGFQENFFPITNAFGHTVTNLMTGGTTPQLFGVRVALGSGMPSRVVPDSTGQNIMIRKTDSTFVRIGVNTGDPARTQFRGWRTR